MKRPLSCNQADASWDTFYVALYTSIGIMTFVFSLPFLLSTFHWVVQKMTCCPSCLVTMLTSSDTPAAAPTSEPAGNTVSPVVVSPFTGVIAKVFTTINGAFSTAITAVVSISWLVTLLQTAKQNQATCDSDSDKSPPL